MRLRAASVAVLLSLTCSAFTAGPAPKDAELVPPGEAVKAARADLEASVHPLDRPDTRYLFDPRSSIAFRRVWQLHQNLLSRDSEVIQATAVRPWLWRINLRDLHWLATTWENARNLDPYFHRHQVLDRDLTLKRFWPGGPTRRGKHYRRDCYEETVRKGKRTFFTGTWLPIKDFDYLREQTYSEVPILRADWLFVQSATQRSLNNDDNTGLGYYDFLRLPDRAAYLKLVDADIDDPKKISPFGREFRDVVEFSKVSPKNRIVVRFQGRGGGLWVTLDVADQRDRGIALDNLFPGQFAHTAEEWYGSLPNRLHVVFTSDQNGKRANVVPGDTHGLHDHSPLNEARSQTIHPILNCNNCHAGGVLKDFRGDIRRSVEPGTYLAFGAQRSKKDKDRIFKRLYLGEGLYPELSDDRQKFQAAVRRHTRLNLADPADQGMDPEAAMRAYARAYYRYTVDPVTLQVAARELGVTQETWLAALRYASRPGSEHYRIFDLALGRYLSREKNLHLSRLTFESKYALAQDLLLAYGAARLRGDEK